MRRREFVTLFGSAAAWPLAAQAQQAERVRRVGMLLAGAADDPEVQARLAAFQRGMSELGWIDGQNLRIDTRWGAGHAASIRRYAAAPRVTRAAILRDATITAGIGQFAIIQSTASSIGMEVSPAGVRDGDEIERYVTAFAAVPNGGLIVTGSGLALVHRNQIISLAARHGLPAVYSTRPWAFSGGLISYGADLRDNYRRAAGYVDRILNGRKPADLPVHMPTRYELVINLKTAKALGLEVPATLLARADEVIE